MSNSSENYLVVKGAGGGGLGDRLWGVLAGILYCRLTGRALHVDWRDGLLGDPDVNAFYGLFELSGIKTIRTLPEPSDLASVYPPVPAAYGSS